ncbi:MAG: UDP-3-O-[3-hydroxymyristoyl] N-acetylglucosamine deacetylase, partial [Marinicaulis sp.]|nr:UDP-3-O-[3-hydroxymyristoyl] N-acetylglucosamine deacetylase [Marinicaulis sp.]
RIVLHPAAVDSGLQFRRIYLNGATRACEIPVSPDAVVQANHGTVIANKNGDSIATVEHLLAALAVLGVDNVIVDVYGDEIPILDGSASPFLEKISASGLTEMDASRHIIELSDAIYVCDGDRSISIEPSDGFSLDVSIEFEDCLIGRQSLSVHIEDPSEQMRIARARTFCRLHEVEGLRNAGLGRGGSLENSIVVDGDRVLNDEALRDPDEFVRHKALDLIGDLYLLGAPLKAAITAEKPGHDLNVRAARAILRQINGFEAEEKPAIAASL